MAITLSSSGCKQGFIVNSFSADASGCEEIVAAVAGKKIKLTSIACNTGATITATIGAGETAGAVTKQLIGPCSFTAHKTCNLSFNPRLELPVNTSLVIDTSGAGDVCVLAQGVIE